MFIKQGGIFYRRRTGDLIFSQKGIAEPVSDSSFIASYMYVCTLKAFLDTVTHFMNENENVSIQKPLRTFSLKHRKNNLIKRPKNTSGIDRYFYTFSFHSTNIIKMHKAFFQLLIELVWVHVFTYQHLAPKLNPNVVYCL